MKNRVIFAISAMFLLGNVAFAQYTKPPYTVEQTQKMVDEFHERLKLCKIDDTTKNLSKKIEKAFYPIEDLDFSHDYDPEFISQLREIKLQNTRFITKFALTSGCKLDDL